MMRIYIVFTGWEDRFRLGAEKYLDDNSIDSLYIFHGDYPSDKEVANRGDFIDYVKKKNIPFEVNKVPMASPRDSWNVISSVIMDKFNAGDEVLLDISTMPREAIWYICNSINLSVGDIKVLYHCPEKYGEWTTEDPLDPRFPLKLSGVSDISKKTFLIIATGFDVARADQIISFYDPDRILFLIQNGKQFGNDLLNYEKHCKYAKQNGIDIVDVNCYNLSETYDVLEAYIVKYYSTHNFILASLGPKLSAIPMFKMQKKFENIALCYAPSKRINQDYSFGFSETYVEPFSLIN